LALTEEFYRTLSLSFLRVMAGFAAGILLGFLFGTASYFVLPLRALLSPLMAIIRATPVASFILVVILWIQREQVPMWIAMIMVLPIVFQNTILGYSSRDPALAEMAKVFRFGIGKTLFRLDLPQVFPYVFSAGRTALGLAWKAGVAAEVLALPKASVGLMIYEAKLYLETVDLYAWTLAIILFSVLIEAILARLLDPERRKHASHSKSVQGI
jgi:NitT/TauT family transport system permease protein